jgi:hypothetical protein
MKRTSEFSSTSRYIYDFGMCSPRNGFAQIDLFLFVYIFQLYYEGRSNVCYSGRLFICYYSGII